MLSENLRQARKRRGLTQDAVADFLNVKRQTYSAYERNVSIPDALTLNKLSGFLCEPIENLLGKDDKTVERGTEKSDTEILGVALKEALIRAGRLLPGEPITKENIDSLVKIVDAIAPF